MSSSHIFRYRYCAPASKRTRLSLNLSASASRDLTSYCSSFSTASEVFLMFLFILNMVLTSLRMNFSSSYLYLESTFDRLLVR